jgi:hypothetical protein
MATALCVAALLLSSGCNGDGASPTEPASSADTAGASVALPDSLGAPGFVAHCPDTVPFIDESGARSLELSTLSNVVCATKLHAHRHVMLVTADLPGDLVPASNVNYDFGDTGVLCRVWARPPISNPNFLGTNDYRFRLTPQGELKGRCVLTDF